MWIKTSQKHFYHNVTCPFLEAFATCEDVLIKLNKPNKIQIRFN